MNADPDEIRRLSRQSTDTLRAFAEAVPKFSMLTEQRVDMFKLVRWWKAPGWDVVRTASGDWLGWPGGTVAWPPLFAQAAASDREAVILDIVRNHRGFWVPFQTSQARALELRLVALRR